MMKNRFFQLLLLIVSVSVISCSNESNVKTTDTRDIEYSGGGHILPPSHLLDGIQPEASWIWDSGEINPRNYYLHVRKSFSLRNAS